MQGVLFHASAYNFVFHIVVEERVSLTEGEYSILKIKMCLFKCKCTANA